MMWISTILLGLIAGAIIQQKKEDQERKSLAPIKVKSKDKRNS